MKPPNVDIATLELRLGMFLRTLQEEYLAENPGAQPKWSASYVDAWIQATMRRHLLRGGFYAEHLQQMHPKLVVDQDAPDVLRHVWMHYQRTAWRQDATFNPEGSLDLYVLPFDAPEAHEDRRYAARSVASLLPRHSGIAIMLVRAFDERPPMDDNILVSGFVPLCGDGEVMLATQQADDAEGVLPGNLSKSEGGSEELDIRLDQFTFLIPSLEVYIPRGEVSLVGLLQPLLGIGDAVYAKTCPLYKAAFVMPFVGKHRASLMIIDSEGGEEVRGPSIPLSSRRMPVIVAKTEGQANAVFKAMFEDEEEES